MDSRRMAHKRQILNAYGNQCEVCRTTILEFLAIDHRHGGGVRDRSQTVMDVIYVRIIREGFPKSYRILCHNCNHVSKLASRKADDEICPQMRWVRKTRGLVLKGYGSQCACCCDTNTDHLALDHVKGGGRKESKELYGRQRVWRRAVVLGFPPEYRLLCHNCNYAYYFLGRCPHEKIATMFR